MLEKILYRRRLFSAFTSSFSCTCIFPARSTEDLRLVWRPGFCSDYVDVYPKGGIPALLAFLAIMAESLGALLLLSGLATRLAAFALAANMIVCAAGNHLKNGFFMNWFGTQVAEGFEYHLLVVGTALALMIKGGGRLSADRLLASDKKPLPLGNAFSSGLHFQ